MHEPSKIIILPLVILSIFSIGHGYIAKDALIGLGTPIWGGSIFISPDNQTMVEGELASTAIKTIPVIGSLIIIIIGGQIYSKIGSIHSIKSAIRIYRFFSSKYHVENIYNSIIVTAVLKLARVTSNKLDKGILEILGATGITRQVETQGKQLAAFDSGFVPHLAINIIMGLLMALSLGEGLIGSEDLIMVTILSMSTSSGVQRKKG